MSLLRRHSAAMASAFVLLLGACGGSEAPTTPKSPVTPGEIDDNPLRIAISPMSMIFGSETATPPAPQTLMTTGLVAIGSAVEFGPTSYTLGTAGWLRVNPVPVFQREPLAWLHTVSIDGAAWAALANGVYQATVPVIVRAAQNSPQMLVVTLCKGTVACLPPNGVVGGTLSNTDGTWNRGNNINAIPGAYWFDDYILTVPAMSTVHLTMHGGCSGAQYTLGDPYIYVFTMAGAFVGSNDDGFGCLNSYLPVVNGTGAPVAYRVRATSWNSGALGSYELRTSTAGPFLRAPVEPSPEFAEIIARKAANPEG